MSFFQKIPQLFSS